MIALLAALMGLTVPDAEASEAAAGAVTLQWRAPASCPDATAVLGDAIALLHDPAPARPLRARGEVAAIDDGFTVSLTIEVDDRGGERRLEATECTELGRMVALVLALAIDPDAAGLDAPDELEPRPDPAPAPVPAPRDAVDDTPVPRRPVVAAPARDTSAPRTASRRELAIDLGIGVGLFALPRASATPTFGLAYVQPWVRAELALQYWTPTTAQSPANTRVGGRFQLLAASLRGCVVPSVGRVELPICAAVDGGAMLGRGTGPLQPPGTAASAWIALGGGPMVLVRLGPARRWGLWARVEGLGVLARPVFVTTPSGTLWRAPAGALRAAVGVELRFGVGARETPARP